MKVGTKLILGLLALATGCASHPANVVFSDEADIRAARVGSANQALPGKLDKEDEKKIEQAVFSYLLGQPSLGGADCAAVFLQADDDQVAALIKKFPGHIPPLKPSDQASIAAHHAPVDKATGRPALILSVEVTDPKADGTVDAVGRWSTGDAINGFHEFHLLRLPDDWQITDVK